MTVITCGAIAIHWLPPEIEINDDELKQWILAEEWTTAQTFKASRRRLEYLRSRFLVRQLTASREPLPADVNGNPSWPEGWVGSITHKDGFVGVALLPQTAWLSVGIDVEDPRRMQAHFASKILGDNECEQVKQQCEIANLDFNLGLTCCFSFKESIYKAIYPLGLRPFYFHDAHIDTVEVHNCETNKLSGRISASLKINASSHTPAGTSVHGNFCLINSGDRHFILTTVGVGRSN